MSIVLSLLRLIDYGLRDYNVGGQIGLEQTPDAYIANLVEVFRECKRILRDDGTLWVVIGDSYAANGEKQTGRNDENPIDIQRRFEKYGTGRPKALTGLNERSKVKVETGLKPKDLIGIPWMLAFALRADGWYLRQDIIWAKAVSGSIRKGSAMPESVKDRFCKSHEYIFLLTKSPRYYFDSVAVADNIDKIKTHEYNGKYGNKNMQQVPSGEAGGSVQQKQPTKRRSYRGMQGLFVENKEALGSKIQYIRERESVDKEILLFGKGAENQKDIQETLSVNGGSEMPLSAGSQRSRENTEIQKSSEEIRSVRERKNQKSRARQKIFSDRKREIYQAEDSNKEKLLSYERRLRFYQRRVAGNEKRIPKQMRLLRTDNTETGNGSRDTTFKRWGTQKREHSSVLPDLQREERQPITATRRSVWLINPKPYKGAHYATYPPELIKPCILAGAPAGGIVFDPFVGSGTTVATAIQLGRRGIGLDLSLKYLYENAKARVEAAELPLLNSIETKERE